MTHTFKTPEERDNYVDNISQQADAVRAEIAAAEKLLADAHGSTVHGWHDERLEKRRRYLTALEADIDKARAIKP